MNINRDYIITINANFTLFIGGKFQLVKRDTPIKFKQHDKNSANLIIVVVGCHPFLQLTMDLISPSGEVDTYTPELFDIKDDVYFYEVKLKNKVLEEIGTHSYQFYVFDGTRKISTNIDKLKVEQCL